MASIDLRVKDAVTAFLQQAARDFHVERAWVYGSRARGAGDAWSDIDLAIESPDFRGRPWLDLHARLWSYKRGAAIAVEPVGLTPEDVARATPADFVGGVILREGVLVWEAGRPR